MTTISDRRRGHVRHASLAVTTALVSILAAPAFAQTAPAPYSDVDANGVDLTDGSFNYTFVEGSIGTGGSSLALSRRYGVSGKTDGFLMELDRGGSHIGLNLGGTLRSFTLSGGVWINDQGDGSTLTQTPGSGFDPDSYTYRTSDGTVITYAATAGGYTAATIYPDFCTASNTSNCFLLPITAVSPDGHKQTYDYRTSQNCSMNIHKGDPCDHFYRISAITNESGYMIKFKYASDAQNPSTGPSSPDWFVRSTAKLINLAYDYCLSSALNCDSTSLSWPTVTYAHPSSGVEDVTDIGGNTWRFTTNSLDLLTGVRRPGDSSDAVSVTYGTNGVSSVTEDGITTGYSRTLTGTNQYTTVRTDPLSHTMTVVADMTVYRPTSVTNEVGKTTLYSYDSNGRPYITTASEGNKAQYAYDARGNVTSVTQKAKSGSPLADIVTYASYPSSCTYPVSCNKPDWTKDANGNQTDYTWDTTTGNILTVTRPAPVVSGTRPKVTYGYSSLQAYYKNASGTIVASGQPVSLLTTTSTCATTSSCAGTADETRKTTAYGSTGVANNLAATSVTDAAGDSSISAINTLGYDRFGNLITVDGPLSGTDDTTTYRYDSTRNLVGAISPDPDGAGSLKRRAQRDTYSSHGILIESEVGTVNGTSDTDWAAFSSLQQVTSTLDNSDRKTKDVATAGGTTYSVTQYSYDSLGRLDCSAQRMNSAVWGSLPSSACTLGTAGSFGADRIIKMGYDFASRPTLVQTAYGTSDQANEVATSYSDNGLVNSQTDANGNKTTYEYDGFDRLSKTRYPSTTTGSGTSSTTDYEELVYDPASNVTSRHLRGYSSDSTKHIDYQYDLLNRMKFKDLPGSEPDVTYSYDLMDRMTGASQSGNALSFAYDQLSRTTSQGGPLGTVSYQYDAAGRRTRMTWPDSYYVTYDYLLTGEVTAIRENGASSGVGVLASYGYDDLGRSNSRTLGSSAATSYGYDGASELTSLGIDLSGTTHDSTSTFGYSPAAQITSVSRSNDAYAWNGAVDLNRGYTINGLNQMTTAGSLSLGFDARGNLTSSGSDSYGYSTENLLTSATVSGASSTFSYDPALRLYQTVGTTTARFQYDGSDAIGEYDGSNVLQKRYVHGPGADELIVSYAGSGTTNRTFLQADERGSIVAASDSSGALLSGGINSYDEYGLPGSMNSGRFRYTGQAWLPELGMYYYKTRMYSPNLGRFMQSDPVGYTDGMNWYAYVENDPVNSTDPSGLDSVCSDGTVIKSGQSGSCGDDNIDLAGFLVTGGGGNVKNGSSGGGKVPAPAGPASAATASRPNDTPPASCSAPLTTGVGAARAVLGTAQNLIDLATIASAATGVGEPVAAGLTILNDVLEVGLLGVNAYDAFANGESADLKAQIAAAPLRLLPAGRLLQKTLKAARGPTGILRNSLGQFRSSYLNNPGIKEFGQVFAQKSGNAAADVVACKLR